ncbi:hypothetical protein IAG44_01095 [Streptomyces roseirectus]|uniref:Secreted protein n=1 Tax=Streptomyces roseirectus TaxID=2768066 RepID=A0A7H0I5Y1_9ACTN|nr:hypothetical protein [Streptomyces roseirectus]QNP68197.1 hypothetical protein IAG44_01095 [Streptomyces roseirectus]
MSTVTRRAATVATGFLLSLVTALATTTTASPATAAAAACPGPGARVKATSPSVFLVDPEGFLRHIPNATVYNRLYAGWSGITTLTDSALHSCWPYDYPEQYPLTDAYLVKTSGSSKVYIYDWGRGGYRWIVNASTFEDKYHFSWADVRTQVLDPDSLLPSWPWD